MRVQVLFAATFAVALALGGCATPDVSKSGEPRPTQAQGEIADLASSFLDLVATGNYEGIRAVILPSQAAGFDPKAFVEDRFRMRVDSFEILAWDRKVIRATPMKEGAGYLSSAVVNVRVLATNEAQPIFVNLRWLESRGKWYIVPFPQAL